MDVDGFLAELPSAFLGFPGSKVPVDRALLPVVEGVEGLSEENNLALLALAARHVDAGECYLEAGAYHGRTLIWGGQPVRGAVRRDRRLLLRGGRSGTAGSEPGPVRSGRPRAGSAGDTSAVLRGAETLPPVGVLFYDAGHTTEATLDALRTVTARLTGTR